MIASVGAPAIEYASADAATATAGSPFSFNVVTTSTPGDALTVSGTLPGGFTFTDNRNGTATIAGTATAPDVGSYPLAIRAANGIAAPATQDFTLTVAG
jgi:hypothetical protein